MITLTRIGCSLVMASLVLPAQPLFACTQEGSERASRYFERERKKRIKVEGMLRIESNFTITRPDEFDKDVIAEETWHFGSIETDKGSTYKTYHNTDNLIVLCGRAQGPVRDATGVFYLQKNPENGNFYIYDWDGDYLPVDTAEN